MKTILRIVIILAVALGIAGVTLLAVNASDAGTAQPSRFREAAGSQGGRQSPGQGQEQLPEGFVPGNRLWPGHAENERGVFSLAETIKNIVIVAIIVLVVAFIERLEKHPQKETRTGIGQSGAT
jgi:hypothetical protein